MLTVLRLQSKVIPALVDMLGKSWLCSKAAWVQIQAPPPISCVILNKLINICASASSSKNINKGTYLTRLLCELNKVMHVKRLDPACLMESSPYTGAVIYHILRVISPKSLANSWPW